jgi:hypothetical protein
MQATVLTLTPSCRKPASLRGGSDHEKVTMMRHLTRYVTLATCLVILSACISHPAASSAAPLQPLGVASVSTMIAGSDKQREAVAIKQAGASAIRIPVKWNLVQPSGKQSFSWGAVDDAVNAARGQGLMILLNLEGPAPYWAQAPGADPQANGTPPANAADFGAFARETALRYGQATAAWEIWNEPNLSHYLIPPTADTYLPLLRAAYTSIRSIGNRAPVVTGGTSSARGETRDIDFISRLYALGGRQYFDGIGVHPYTFPYPITQDPRFGDGGGAAVLPRARALMEANGDAAKKIWITEFGQPTGNTPVSTTEARQAEILVDAIRQARLLSWIAAFFIFNTVDLVPNSPEPNFNFGLYRNDYSPKPAVNAIRTLLAG